MFADLADWQLVVTGDVAGEYRQRTGPGREAVVIGGYVDETMRALAYSAADVVVASFRPGFHRDSGVVMDAVSWGVPVVCSDGCPPADVVREYRLGLVFEPGNPDSLERAVRTVPRRVEPADLARARGALEPCRRARLLKPFPKRARRTSASCRSIRRPSETT